ncbi:MAG: FtsX-like permease family protein [Planctomycetaceae bacterium]|jgi:lipoprotein-releasing system permease protein|nr:FtsX-like permease family protein [Planctomycetaceae bacterium]
MYKILLCWRYLLSRYIATASIISVMLGTATMIVVNAVMLGFTSEMQVRIHGILSDVIFQSRDLNKGFPDYPWHRDQILNAAGDLIDELTPLIFVPGMITYRINGSGEPVSMPVDIFGIDCRTQGKVSDIAKYLQHPENSQYLSFDLKQDGYSITGNNTAGSAASNKAAHRFELGYAGWTYRRRYATEQKRLQGLRNANAANPPPATAANGDSPSNPFAPSAPTETNNPAAQTVFDPAKEQHTGAIVGIGISFYDRLQQIDPDTNKKIVIDKLALIPGDDVMLTFPTAELPLRFQSGSFTVTDLYESKMVDYDRKLVFVPIEKLQQLRGMYDEQTGKPTVTQVLIKAKPGTDINVLRDRLREKFPVQLFSARTWRDDQASLLSAVYNELAMLNVLLFLIFAVAGFGILAIFYMIVVEKQKDIGILKSLGAGSGGIMQIFLYYSLLLGIVGSGLGLALGLTIVRYIKEIAWGISQISGSEVFSPEIYSFYEIPTIVDPITVVCIIVGAVIIAVLSGVLPALRAARLNPVETLRG